MNCLNTPSHGMLELIRQNMANNENRTNVIVAQNNSDASFLKCCSHVEVLLKGHRPARKSTKESNQNDTNIVGS